MDSYQGLLKILEEHNKRMQKLAQAVSPLKALQKSVTINLPKIEIPKFEIPHIKFPKIELPKIKIDYEKIEKLIEHNSSNGWTLTGEMEVNFYLNEDLLQMERKQIDDVFVHYYEVDSKKNYLTAKSCILDEIDERWINVLNDCFELYEAEKYMVIIPLLITIIEGEISNITESNLFGKKLLNEWEARILSEQEKMLIIVSHSLFKYLSSTMFAYKQFSVERGSEINRNWVLHGRDNPNLWTKVDSLKLINTLATFQFIKS
ncbi:hypothetical protein [Bacillus sp. JJ1562]|uniref:hypothetical protein n=1 Tax=Bacillus sp. JJ1562 TaxID=3122960 RepID=UPI003001B9D8